MKWIALPLTFLGLLSVASADALRDQINSTNAGVCKAMQNKDLNAFAKILKPITAPDFIYSEPGQKPMNFDQMVAGMKMGLGQLTKITYVNSHILSIKGGGTSKMASIVHEMAGVMPDAKKKPHTLSYKLISQDKYELKGGKWIWKSMTITTTEMKMDGKAFNPSKM